jgi:GTPase SAR1 family protein
MSCFRSDDFTPEERAIQRQIEKDLIDEKARMSKEIKLLLLGTGDSGKSTIAKQMKIIYLSSFSDEERKKWKTIIHYNIISYTKFLHTQMLKFDLKFDNPKNEEYIQNFLNIGETMDNAKLTPELAKFTKSIWGDKGIQETWANNFKYQISDSVPYFMERAETVAEDNYEVSDEDVLYSRVKTTGIVEVQFSIDNELFRMVDVGGQRSERKKWIHCFQDVTSIIFVVALSEYNLMLEENDQMNRMQESIKLFDDIINNVWFLSTNVILFLNKRDIFEEKYEKKKIPLNVCFDDFPGGTCDQAKEFIAKKYQEKNKNTTRQVFSHFTCATNTDNVKVVFRAIRSIIVDEMIAKSGLVNF